MRAASSAQEIEARLRDVFVAPECSGHWRLARPQDVRLLEHLRREGFLGEDEAKSNVFQAMKSYCKERGLPQMKTYATFHTWMRPGLPPFLSRPRATSLRMGRASSGIATVRTAWSTQGQLTHSSRHLTLQPLLRSRRPRRSRGSLEPVSLGPRAAARPKSCGMIGHISESWAQGGEVRTERPCASQLPRMPGKSSSLSEDVDEYNEQLQEDVFLGKLEIKNTFYNFPVKHGVSLNSQELEKEWVSAPPNLLQRSWRTKFPEMEAAHQRGECKPCGYFLYKTDGCRNGASERPGRAQASASERCMEGSKRATTSLSLSLVASRSYLFSRLLCHMKRRYLIGRRT
eukprot:g31685.t1